MSDFGVSGAWLWKENSGPPMTPINNLLKGWQVYRGNGLESLDSSERRFVGTPSKKQVNFKSHFQSVVDLIKPISGLTILCNWDEKEIEEIYDKLIPMLGSTVLITKALHFLLPDLFLIVDRTFIWTPFKSQIFGNAEFDKISSASYIKFMASKQQEIYRLIHSPTGVTLRDGKVMSVNSGDEFRTITPYPIASDLRQRDWDVRYTLGRLIDDALRF